MKINAWGIFSLIMFGVVYSSLWDHVGKTRIIRNEPYGVLEIILLGFMLLGIWGLGYFSKFNR